MFVRLVGVFEVRDDLQRDCTPRGAKARAILAMLCQTPDRRRARRWLEARLWSDRGAEQASGSLRQALMEIRKSLGDEAGLLVSDRDSVRLTRAVTDLEADPAAAARALQSGREFLEGIDILDPAFDGWLREERARVEAQMGTTRPAVLRVPMARTAQLPLVVRVGSLPEGLGTFAGVALADAIARLVAEFAHVDVYGASGTAIPEDLPAEGMAIHVEGAQIQDRMHVLVSLSGVASAQTIWNQRASIPLGDAEAITGGEVPPLVFQAADAALAHFPQLTECAEGPRRANALIARALVETFSCDGARLRAADAMLVEAGELAPSGRIHAWRCLVRHVAWVERTETDYRKLTEELDEFSRKALEHSQANPLVLALVSAARVMVDENPEAGMVLARDAIALSPFNAFGRWAQAAALIRIGDNASALDAARKGVEIAASTAHVHHWEAMAGLAALRGGHMSAALAHYESAHYRAPGFRAAMRHLLFLYLWSGRHDKAALVLKALIRVEPDFTLDRIQNDPDYPAVTLRKSGLLERFASDVTALWPTV
jgi:tetratricopeptide (TPR) repeat protein